MSEQVSMETLVSWAKRRGFVYPSSEIYGGFASAYDYGPLGVELKNNIRDSWWNTIVHGRRDVEGLDGAIVGHPAVWKASGHVDGFSDPLAECKECHKRSRVDQLIEEKIDENVDGKSLKELDSFVTEHNITCPHCEGELMAARSFNLLVETSFGTTEDSKTVAYLRGETCQTIFTNFKNVLETSRQKVPFGIAQIGKAFRNEITLEQFIFRTREFEQMELQYFIKPEHWQETFEEWQNLRMDWHRNVLGLGDNVRFREQTDDERSFYAQKAVDIEYNFSFGWKEIEGLHYRGDHDLSSHIKASGVELNYFDQANNERFVPHVMETSAGLTRSMLALMVDSYTEETLEGGDTRVVAKFPFALAPIKVAVLPLSKKPELSGVAVEVFETLKKHFVCQYDETQSIGKRYRRQDEIGTPFCVTVDFDSLEDKAVTIRNRDTMKQERVAITDLVATLTSSLNLDN